MAGSVQFDGFIYEMIKEIKEDDKDKVINDVVVRSNKLKFKVGDKDYTLKIERNQIRFTDMKGQFIEIYGCCLDGKLARELVLFMKRYCK